MLRPVFLGGACARCAVGLVWPAGPVRAALAVATAAVCLGGKAGLADEGAGLGAVPGLGATGRADCCGKGPLGADILGTEGAGGACDL